MENSIYKIHIMGDVAVLTLALENIAWQENEELKKAFKILLDEGKKNIVLDLSNITFISSIVLASLVFMLKRSKEAGGDLVICSAKDKVKEVIEITNLDKVFDIFEDRKKALTYFTKK